jgi:hypothetical protein
MAKVNRSSKSGKFVTSRYAKKHKATTQTETVKKKKKLVAKKGGNKPKGKYIKIPDDFFPVEGGNNY